MESNTRTSLFCRDCNKDQPISKFNRRVRDGKRVYEACLDCQAIKQASNRKHRGDEINSRRREVWGDRHRSHQKNYMLKKAYGITLESWNEMFASQGNRCGICLTDDSKGRGWQTDHNHATGKVRAILCHHCNSMLGHAMESEFVLQAAINYLKKHNNEEKA